MKDNKEELFNDWIDLIDKKILYLITNQDRRLLLTAFKAGFVICEKIYEQKLQKYLNKKGI